MSECFFSMMAFPGHSFRPALTHQTWTEPGSRRVSLLLALSYTKSAHSIMRRYINNTAFIIVLQILCALDLDHMPSGIVTVNNIYWSTNRIMGINLLTGSRAADSLHDLVNDRRLMSDLLKSSSRGDTSNLEAFHSLLNTYAPKHAHYKSVAMLSR